MDAEFLRQYEQQRRSNDKTLTYDVPTLAGGFVASVTASTPLASSGGLTPNISLAGIVDPAHGGTGINNSTRTITINTNNAAFTFSSAGKTLTVGNSLILIGTDGKTLNLGGNLIVAADTTISGGGTLALGGFVLTVPATGTAALLAVQNIFTAQQEIRVPTATERGLRIISTDDVNTRNLLEIRNSTLAVAVVNILGHAAFGSSVVSNTTVLRANKTFADLASNYRGIQSDVIATAAAASTSVLIGLDGAPVLNQNGFNVTTARGIIGIQNKATVSGTTGTVTGAAGATYQVVNSGAGNLTNGYGAYFVANANTGGGGFTNNYFIYAENIGTVGSALNYFIYSEGGQSYHAGNFGIGQTTPTAYLHIKAGTASANTAPIKLTSGTLNTTAEAGTVEFLAERFHLTPTSLARQVIPGVLFTQTADKTVSNTVTETSIVGTGVGSLTLPAAFWVAGKTVRLRIGGIYSTPALATPSIIIKVKLGSTTIATVTTTALLSGATNLAFDGEVLITCRTTGATGTVVCHGDIEYATGVAGTIAVDPLNNAGATTTIDTTASALIDVTIQWDAATATRSAKSFAAACEVLN